jgi:hypothetical protein
MFDVLHELIAALAGIGALHPLRAAELHEKLEQSAPKAPPAAAPTVPDGPAGA